MKILLATNIKDISDEVIGKLAGEGTNIVAKETAGDTKELVRSVYKLQSLGNFGIAIVVPDDHVAASMMLSKYQDMRVAVCSNEEDIGLAMKNSANVIVFKSAAPDRVLNAIRNILDDDGTVRVPQKQAEERPVAAKPFKVELPRLFQGIGKQAAPQVKKKEKAKPAPEYDDSDEIGNGEVKGVFSRLKNSLGIIDEEV